MTSAGRPQTIAASSAEVVGQPGQPTRWKPSWGWTVLAVFFGGLALIVACYLAYKLQRVLLLFAIAYFVAYFLEPLIKQMQGAGVSRLKAIWIVIAALVVVIALVTWTLTPMLVGQAQDAVSNWSVYSERALEVFDRWRSATEVWLGERYPDANVNEIIAERSYHARRWFTSRAPAMLQWISMQFMASLGMIGLSLIVLVISFHFMRVKTKLETTAKQLIPREHTDEVAEIGHDITAMLGRYLQALVLLMILTMVATWLGLEVVGLFFGSKYALTIAVIAGVFRVVPYFGSIVTLGSAGILTYMTAGNEPLWAAVAAIAVAALIDQIFDLIVRPNLVGRRIDLHPVIGLFAVIAGYQLLGLVGMIIGMPLAASIKIILAKWIPVIGSPPGVRAPSEPLHLDVAHVAADTWDRLRQLSERVIDSIEN